MPISKDMESTSKDVTLIRILRCLLLKTGEETREA